MSDYDEISTEEIAKSMDPESQQNLEDKKEVVTEDTQQNEPQQKQAPVYKYTARGKEISEPLDMILKRASMGYDYAQRMEELKSQQARIAEIQNRNSELSVWEEYDKYAKENPKWADHVREMYEKKTQYADPNLDPNDPLVQRISGLETTLEEKIGKLDNFLQTQQVQREDSQLSNEIKSIKEKYPDIDFVKTDPESGNSLELQVLQHMKKNNLVNFGIGFRDFYHDKLVERAKLKAKEDVANDIKKRQKQGILDESSTPFNSDVAKNAANLSYEQLAEMAKKEMGI